MGYYCGIDLHSNNNYIGIIDESGKKIFKKKSGNHLPTIIETLKPFKKKIKGIVIESTFNWYWLVDGLMSSEYKVHLANTTAIQQYSGLKYTDDNSDTLWLAEMLRLKILPEGHIHPPKERAVRDLLRRRMQLVQHRTALYLSMKGMINNCTGKVISRNDLISLCKEDIEKILTNPHQVMSAGSICTVTSSLSEEIHKIEKAVVKEVRLKKEYKKLLTVHGIGKILGITIMLAGKISRACYYVMKNQETFDPKKLFS